MLEQNSRREPYEQRKSIMEEVIRAMNRVNPKGYYTTSAKEKHKTEEKRSCITYHFQV